MRTRTNSQMSCYTCKRVLDLNQFGYREYCLPSLLVETERFYCYYLNGCVRCNKSICNLCHAHSYREYDEEFDGIHCEKCVVWCKICCTPIKDIKKASGCDYCKVWNDICIDCSATALIQCSICRAFHGKCCKDYHCTCWTLWSRWLKTIIPTKIVTSNTIWPMIVVCAVILLWNLVRFVWPNIFLIKDGWHMKTIAELLRWSIQWRITTRIKYFFTHFLQN